MQLKDKYKTLLNSYGINTPLRLSHFFAQIHHESNLKPIEEKFNYSKKRLLEIFKYDFDVNRDRKLSLEEIDKANDLLGNPQKIANFVYANQNGNGNEQSGDGWKYRGRGFIQITGKDNYTALSKDTKTDYVKNPDLLLNEADSMISALWFWKKHNLNALADKDDIRAITKKINGGFNGIEHRVQLLKKYKDIFSM